MTAICKSKTLRLLAAVLALCLIVTLSAVSVFAEADADNAATESATESIETGETSAPETTTGDDATETAGESSTATEDASASESVTSTSTSTSTTAGDSSDDDYTGLINLIVGGVILIAIVVLAIVFRKKIPGWYKGVKSECGKIVWCPKDKLKKNTLVVVVIIVALAILIALLDLAFSKGIALLQQLVS